MSTRLDATDIANAGRYLSRQLEQTMPQVYEKRYAKLWAEEGQHLTANPTLEKGATAVIEDIVESVGEAVELSDLTNDYPTVSVSEGEDKYNVHTFVAAYAYTIPQLHAASKAGKDIDKKRVKAVDRVLRQKVHELAVFGSKKRGSNGFFNHPSVPIYTTGYDANTASWQDAIDFVSQVISSIEDRNELTESVSKLIIPNKLWRKWFTTYQSGDSGKSALEAIEAAGKNKSLKIVAENECRADILEKFGVKPPGTNEDRLVFVPENEDVAERLYYPPDYLPAQLHGMQYKVIAYVGTSETMIHYPEAMGYVDIPKVL